MRLRASEACEYCKCPADYAFDTYHVDHIIAEVHGGSSHEDNLAWACPHCNGSKSSNLATYLPEKDMIIRLFNPRRDDWSAHFKIKESGEIATSTDVGRGTIRLLELNALEFVELRKILLKCGLL